MSHSKGSWLTPRRVDRPEAGYFELTLVHKGPLVGARITFEDGLWQASIDEKPCGPPHADPVFARDVYRLWYSGRRIDRITYNLRISLAKWAREHDPEHPAARPDNVIDLNSRRPLF